MTELYPASIPPAHTPLPGTVAWDNQTWWTNFTKLSETNDNPYPAVVRILNCTVLSNSVCNIFITQVLSQAWRCSLNSRRPLFAWIPKLKFWHSSEIRSEKNNPIQIIISIKSKSLTSERISIICYVQFSQQSNKRVLQSGTGCTDNIHSEMLWSKLIRIYSDFQFSSSNKESFYTNMCQWSCWFILLNLRFPSTGNISRQAWNPGSLHRAQCLGLRASSSFWGMIREVLAWRQWTTCFRYSGP